MLERDAIQDFLAQHRLAMVGVSTLRVWLFKVRRINASLPKAA